MENRKPLKIMWIGGGTLGPVTPLLAVLDAWRLKDFSLHSVWVGTPMGPERSLVESRQIPFFTLPVLRFPRYPTLEWIRLPFVCFSVFHRAWKVLRQERPDFLAAAGGFTSFPLVIIGRWMGIPAWIHQPDAKPLLTNRLLAPFARVITVAWPHLLSQFPKSKTSFLGHPVRSEITTGNVKKALQDFELDSKHPTVLVLGGGTGAQWINKTMEQIGPSLAHHMNVIHVTGRGKMDPTWKRRERGYVAVEFLSEQLPDVLALADLVISRAGMGAISELAACAKATMLIPIPDSLQEENAKILEREGAVVVVRQTDMTQEALRTTIENLMADTAKRALLSEQIAKAFPSGAADKFVDFLTPFAHS